MYHKDLCTIIFGASFGFLAPLCKPDLNDLAYLGNASGDDHAQPLMLESENVGHQGSSVLIHLFVFVLTNGLGKVAK